MSVQVNSNTKQIITNIANASFVAPKEKWDEILQIETFQARLNDAISDLGPYINGEFIHVIGIKFRAIIPYGSTFLAPFTERGFVEWTPFQLACALGNPELVQYLIKHGADVNEYDAYDRDCVYIAMYMRALFDEFNDYTYLTTQMRALLEIQSIELNTKPNYPAVIKLLREKEHLLRPTLTIGPNDMEFIMEECVLEYDKTTKSVWDFILKDLFRFFNINTPFEIFGPNVEESSGTLFWNWFHEERYTFELPIQYRGRVGYDNVTYVQWTAFQYVCASGNSLLVDFLLECGGDPKIQDSMGMNSKDIVEYMSTQFRASTRWNKFKMGKSRYFDDHAATLGALRNHVSIAFPLFSRSTSSFLNIDIKGTREIGIKRGQKDTDLQEFESKFQK
jgi:hypothetical protein